MQRWPDVRRLQAILLAWLFCVLPLGLIRAQSPITLTIGPPMDAPAIASDFIGLSFETQILLSGAHGQCLFNGTNKPLIALFKTLGVKSLRIGGNTADLPKVRIPSPPEIDSLFAFAQAAGVKVIYTLRLRNGNMTNDAAIARYIEQHYSNQLSYFAIGNEPDYYRKVYPILKTYPAYRDAWKNFATVLRSAGVTTPFCGPCTGGLNSWTRDFASDFAPSGLVALITQHDYPGGSSRRTTNAATARDELLSSDWLSRYDNFYNSFATTAISNHLPYRLEEASNFSDGGVKNASDSFAGALWGLDYMYWWAVHGAIGINFHGRRWVPNCVIRPAVGQGCNVHPIGYGIKAFDLGSHGSLQSLTLANPHALDLTAYAVRQGTNLFVTIINKSHGDNARSADVTLLSHASTRDASIIFLTASESNVAAQAGVTLGGAVIEDDGSWHGKWTPLEPSSADRYHLHVPAASAAVVKL
jgi:hypothetical protein